jgi:hypothetical protein
MQEWKIFHIFLVDLRHILMFYMIFINVFMAALLIMQGHCCIFNLLLYSRLYRDAKPIYHHSSFVEEHLILSTVRWIHIRIGHCHVVNTNIASSLKLKRHCHKNCLLDRKETMSPELYIRQANGQLRQIHYKPEDAQWIQTDLRVHSAELYDVIFQTFCV